ncbi:MAG TPA: thioredoxin domain-containing protein [Gammaproteobacteria bacterium]|nr:thioredoxin domain-containing protein [Gammaproteobacteria bacterium]
MIRSLLLLSALLLAACQQAPEANNASTPAAPASQATSAEGEAPASAQAPATASDDSAASEASQPSARQAEAADSATGQAAAAGGDQAETSAAKTDADPRTDQAAEAAVLGSDYEAIQGGQPFEPLEGKIEVVEVFNYICPACASFEPLFTAWKAKTPPDVRVTYVPAPFNPQWVPYARAYIVAKSMDLVEKTHTAMFHAIHVDHSLPGEGQKTDEPAIAAFYGKYGADPKRFLAAMDSFSTMVKINRSNQFIAREGVDSTPTIIVDGKYRVITRKSYADVLRVTDALIEMERADMKRAPK